MLVSISGRCSHCAVRGAGAAEAVAASPVAPVSFFREHLLQQRCCNDCSLFLNWPTVIPRLFWNYDMMLTKIQNLENQDFLSCHMAAVLAEVEEAVAGNRIEILRNPKITEFLKKPPS
jgi:hypothetical protein